jgi:uncharacterized membrane protein
MQQTTTYSRTTTWLVLAAAFGIIGMWLVFTPAGIHGKADAVGYAICHRIGERSFEVAGRPLPLCARCTGIYLGAAVTLSTFIASGRGRASKFYDWKIIGVLALFVVVLGIDGVNSYFNLFPGYEGPYAPRNWLRLTTGVFTGISLASLIFPIFNQNMWRDGGQQVAPIGNMKELAGLCALGALAVLLTLSQNATILLAVGLISAAAVVVVMTMIMSVMFTTVTGTYNQFSSLAEMRITLLAGLTMAIVMIGVINFGRYQWTGTWEGFVF